MSWIADYRYSWYETLAMKVLRAGGHIPRHIAVVMDGNRRYARSEHLRKIDGHSRGFEKLADCLRWCLDMGVYEVTTFAFSIENFKRSDEEVNGLFDLAREKFHKLLQESLKLKEHGVRIRVIGNIALLPEDLQQLIAQAMLQTESNDKLFLNVAFSYTSRDEITQAVEQVLKHGDGLEYEDINDLLLEQCLYSRHSSPPDLLLRTSGETRLSDFLMWQISRTVLYFTKVLWPNVSIWHFLGGIFAYQRATFQLDGLNALRLRHETRIADSTVSSERVQGFLKRLDDHKRDILLSLASTN